MRQNHVIILCISFFMLVQASFGQQVELGIEYVGSWELPNGESFNMFIRDWDRDGTEDDWGAMEFDSDGTPTEYHFFDDRDDFDDWQNDKSDEGFESSGWYWHFVPRPPLADDWNLD